MAMVIIKSAREIRGMREAGRVVARILDAAGREIRPGVRTRDLEALAVTMMAECGAESADLGYRPDGHTRPYPAAICVSVNDEVVHGIPGSRRLAEGDLVSVDVTVRRGGLIADAARTFAVGHVSPEAARLIEVTEAALSAGIAACRAGNRVSDISHAVQTLVESAGFAVVRALCGHGVGRSMHEEPEVPNFGEPGRGIRLQPGMTLAIEPMVAAGSHEVRVDRRDGWTVRTRDGSLAAHTEHTVAVGEDGPEILTLP